MAPKMNGTKEEFIEWCKELCKDTDHKSAAYLEAYHYLLGCFVDADCDKDGQIDVEEFDAMIARTAFQPRRYGLAPKEEDMFKSKEDRLAARQKMFNTIDTNGDTKISFNEFLEWSVGHIKEKASKI